MLGKFFAPLAVKIGAGIIAVLLLALALLWWQNGRLEGQRDKAVQLAANERAAHAVTKASLANLEQRLATYIADGKRRSEAAQEAVEAQRERSTALDAQIARMRSQRPTAGEIERCETPRSVRGLEGL